MSAVSLLCRAMEVRVKRRQSQGQVKGRLAASGLYLCPGMPEVWVRSLVVESLLLTVQVAQRPIPGVSARGLTVESLLSMTQMVRLAVR